VFMFVVNVFKGKPLQILYIFYGFKKKSVFTLGSSIVLPFFISLFLRFNNLELSFRTVSTTKLTVIEA
jgi:hypothetical protein